MAYRYDKNQNGEYDLVIDGFEKGIASSPFKGIGNIRNLNIKYYEGVAYMNYKRQASVLTNANGVSSGNATVTIASPAVFTLNSHGLLDNDAITLTTTGALPTGLSTGVTYFVTNKATNTFQVALTRGGTAVNTTGTQSGTHTFTVVCTSPIYSCVSPAGRIYIADDNRNVWQQAALNASTFQVISGSSGQPINGIQFWNNYLFVLGGDLNGKIEICGDGTGDAGVNSGNWNSPTATPVNFTVTIATPAVFTSANHGLTAGSRLRLTTTGALPTGLSINTTYYVISTGLTASTFQVSGTYNGAAVNTSGSQSGTQSYVVARGMWPINNALSLTLNTVPVAGETSNTISSVTDYTGGITGAIWNGPTGFYNANIITTSGNQVVLISLVQGANAVSWTPALNYPATSTNVSVFINGSTVVQTGVEHPSLVAANTGDMYFGNGSNLGAFTLNPNQIFNKNDMTTFTFYTNILALPPTETISALTELKNQLIVSGKYRLYPWDFINPFWNNPIPMDELINKTINILNNIYIFAGNKGNIYFSNGFSVQRFAKLPDYIAGVIDPAWTIGGIMQHRQKLNFQAIATNSATGSVIFGGVFSIDLDSGALNMENQNSGGLLPTGLLGPGVLIDNTSSAINYDKYFSGYTANVSHIDFNDTTLYSSDEGMIESDIIPIGTFAQSKTFGSAEFKLDQPMQSGDSIKLYARQSLSDTYTLLGTTTSALLSDFYTPVPIQKWQWVQFKALMSCNPTAASSSFNRLREIRIR